MINRENLDRLIDKHDFDEAIDDEINWGSWLDNDWELAWDGYDEPYDRYSDFGSWEAKAAVIESFISEYLQNEDCYLDRKDLNNWDIYNYIKSKL